MCACVAVFSCHCLQLLFAEKREFKQRVVRLLTLRDGADSSSASSSNDEGSDKDSEIEMTQHHTIQDLSGEEIICLQR